ncbi:MAG: ATP-dependent DNA ligase, partial [Polyangiaceae bacterium]
TSYREHGDFGSSAADLVVGHAPAGDPLTLHDVALAFASLAATGAQAHKLRTLVDLFSRTRPHGDTNLEAKYLAKLILGDMRTGVKASLVEEAIAEAASVELEALRRAVTLIGDLVRVAEMAFEGSLGAAKMKLFHPLGFMLASPADTVEEATSRFVQEEGKVHAQIEDKYDGIRAQLHFGDATEPGRVAIFSRTRGEITKSFPEIAETLEKADAPAILDGEILGWDFEAERALPFSALQTRLGRKKVTDAIRKETPVIFMAFDVLFAGDSLTLERPLSDRRALLEKIVETERAAAKAGQRNVISRGQMSLFDAPSALPQDRVRVSPAFRVDSASALDEAYRAARERGNEGVMLKALDSKYEPGRRGHAWIKLKRELATLDVVVTAAEYGHGKRAKVLSDYT